MSNPTIKLDAAKQTQAETATEQKTDTQTARTPAWSVVSRVRVPHRVGLPLGSGGCCDQIGH